MDKHKHLEVKRVSYLNRQVMTDRFYDDLFEVLKHPENNRKSNLPAMEDVYDVKRTINRWFDSGSSDHMFFLYDGGIMVGMLQTFAFPNKSETAITLGYIVRPDYQGKGLGTYLLKYATDALTNEFFDLYLSIRRDNFASERIAIKNGYEYDSIRPDGMVLYRYRSHRFNEQFDPMKDESILSNKLLKMKDQVLIISGETMYRVNPSIISLEEYMYFSCSPNYKDKLEGTYYLWGPVNNNTRNNLLKVGVKSNRIVIPYTHAGLFGDDEIVDTKPLEELLSSTMYYYKAHPNWNTEVGEDHFFLSSLDVPYTIAVQENNNHIVLQKMRQGHNSFN